ncbi:pectate lyase family protein [Xylanibacter muris]|uniref:Por secretion system protein n=1 Tax=Xylanibacter muris TaxID=2736290 RepID=A0ABX2ANX3_9BACT|nr:Por secretion system protein [Xylanibacter muris]NPD91932.1 Por secretion system protein [Xylanibacter muris]
MKKLITLTFCALSSMASVAQQLAFPGAEGFGKYTSGGRGGNIYYVTRNDDCTDNNLVEGTLRWALRTGDDTPRTILFKTSGTIYLTSQLKFSHPNVTIAGQTAQGGGICIAGYKIYVCKPNVILRYLRFRAGDYPAKSMPSLDVENTDHVIIDHCSLTWSMEECLTMYDCDSTTVQYCIIGEGLYNSKNTKGARAYATQWGGEHSTMHHCLITNCNNRTPRFNGVRDNSNNPGDHDQHVDSEFFNNVIFNWGKPNSVYGGECDPTINGGDSYNRVYMKGNYFRPGPTTQNYVKSNRYFVEASNKNKGMGQWLLEGNKFEESSAFAPSGNVWADNILKLVAANNYYGIDTKNAGRTINFTTGTPADFIKKNIVSNQTAASGIVAETADEAYIKVTTTAGASLPRYDEVDRRLLDEAAGLQDPIFAGIEQNGSYSRGLGIINSPEDVMLSEHDTFTAIYEGADGSKTEVIAKAWPYLGLRKGEKYMKDTDGDGMPDAYETEMGLNPENPTDGVSVTAGGYTNLEIYLNGVADGTIDKAKYETEDATAVDAVRTDSVESRAEYTIGGTVSASSSKGVSIVRETLSDGSIRTKKVMGL